MLLCFTFYAETDFFDKLKGADKIGSFKFLLSQYFRMCFQKVIKEQL